MTEQGTFAIPEATAHVRPSTPEEVDAAVAAVAASRKAWVDTSIDERIDLLDRCINATMDAAEAWAHAVVDLKDLEEQGPLAGEAWLAGPAPTLRFLRLLRRSLDDIREHSEPQVDLTTRPSGQVVARVMPLDRLDSVLFTGFSAEVWLDPRLTLDEATARVAERYRDAGKDGGGVCFVLGAGNISSIAPTDALSKLFVDDRVVVLKLNPVNESVGRHLEQALAPLVEADLLRFVYGGAAVGSHASEHPDVDELHLTGSDKTYDAIVFGTGDDAARRKRDDEPVNARPFTAELGNVTPIIVVPGPWSDREVAFQGESLAAMLTHNAGFNCVAGRVVVTHQRWAKRTPLLDAMRTSLAAAPHRRAYYPGARHRWERFVAAYPQAEWFGPDDEDEVPFTLIPGIPAQPDELALCSEVFAGVIGEAPLDAPTSVPDYVEQAVRFVNEEVWGSLAAVVVVHPASLKDPAVKAAVERAVADLRYGTVCVNTWPGVAFGLMSTPWGAFPGNPRTAIGSGAGFVHNPFMLPDVQKSVVRGPFKPPSKPVWFHSHRTLDEIGPRVTELEATGDLRLLPSLLWQALRG